MRKLIGQATNKGERCLCMIDHSSMRATTVACTCNLPCHHPAVVGRLTNNYRTALYAKTYWSGDQQGREMPLYDRSQLYASNNCCLHLQLAMSSSRRCWSPDQQLSNSALCENLLVRRPTRARDAFV